MSNLSVPLISLISLFVFLPDLPDLPVNVEASQLPVGPPRQFGAGVTGSFEGWFTSPEGTQYFLVGYLNRNFEQTLDVPIGPNNRIEPGGPDLGQPTHFLPGRQTGVFLVTVPKGFTPKDRLTWTIVANGQTNVIPLRLHPDYVVSPFSDVAIKNTPPIVRFEENGAAVQGPLALLAQAPTRMTTVTAPLPLTIWTLDDARYASGTMAIPRKLPPPVELTWSKYRGPGQVAFDPAKPALETLSGGAVNVPFSGKAAVTARFSQPGEYVLHVTANDYSGEGGGGEVCCWTTALIKVLVKE
jgi:hypothetical protein